MDYSKYTIISEGCKQCLKDWKNNLDLKQCAARFIVDGKDLNFMLGYLNMWEELRNYESYCYRP